MANKNIKIPFSYRRLKRAADLLQYSFDDILNLGVTGKISLCLNLQGLRSVLYVKGDIKSATKWFNGLINNGSVQTMGVNITEFSRMHLYPYRYDSTIG